MSAGYPSTSGRLYVWHEQHRGHEVERDVVYILDDDPLYWPPTSEITLRCLECGESLRMDLST
jgi:hypothetical protein